MMNLQLKKFDLRQMADDTVIVTIGKRHTGKSFLIKEILYYKRDIPVGTVISGTEGDNQFYSKIIPPIFIYEEYDPIIVANYVKRQKKMKKRIKNGETDIDPRAFLIFDDCLFDNKWILDKNVRCVFMNGRHYSCLYILSLQFSLGIPPVLRTNIDYVFILREPNISNRKRIYEHYAGIFPTFEMFCTTMDQCTENYECLVIDNTSISNKIEDQVFWYKAEDHGDFKIGPKEIWDYSEQNYVEDEEDEEININTYHRNRRGPKLNVKKIQEKW